MNAITRKSLFRRAGVFAILFALILMLGMPAASYATEPAVGPDTTGTINIYKLKIDDPAYATPEVSGEITGTLPNMTGREPVAGVKFTLVPVNEVSAAAFALETGTKFTVGTRYFVATGTGAESAATDTSGLTSFTGLALGAYYISETTSVNGVTPATPFVVNIPTIVDGNAVTTVNVYPKGYESDLEKTTSAPGGTATVGDKIDWTISATVAADYNYIVGGTTSFSMVDKPSAGLKFVDGSEAVKINGGSALVKGTDYTVSPAGPYAGGANVTFTFLPDGLAQLSPGDTVTVDLKTEILDAASSIDPTTNEATLDYTNSDGTNSTTSTDPDDKPSVKIGGLSFYKVDPIKGIGLDGATFKLVKKFGSAGYEADLAAAKADNHSDASSGYYKNTETNAVFEAISGSDGTLGKIEFTGLAYGDYWLVETAAPSGYRLIGEAIPVTVGATTGTGATSSYDEGLLIADAQAGQFTTTALGTPINTLTVDNYVGFQFPLTGGMGTLLFVVIGIVLVGLAGIVIVSSRRKSKKAME
jgi:fimbrial isopeptide formation D2 family protein/LPXTG-motif cell wall-anchored protein